MKNKNKDITPVYVRMPFETYENTFTDFQCGHYRERDNSIAVYLSETTKYSTIPEEAKTSTLLSLAIKVLTGIEGNKRQNTKILVETIRKEIENLNNFTLHEIKKEMQKIQLRRQILTDCFYEEEIQDMEEI